MDGGTWRNNISKRSSRGIHSQKINTSRQVCQIIKIQKFQDLKSLFYGSSRMQYNNVKHLRHDLNNFIKKTVGSRVKKCTSEKIVYNSNHKL